MIDIDLSEILAQFDTLLEELPEVVDQALEQCGQAVADEEGKRTKGKLSQSFYTVKIGNDQIVDTDKAYAQYIEYGRGPVTAINAKALRFFINGEVIFRKSVGPAKAQPFVQPAIRAATQQFSKIFDENIKRLIK